MKNEIEKTEHTPTLAIFGPFSGTYHIETVGTDRDKLICTTQDKEHAELIVKAVNSHYELLEEIKLAKQVIFNQANSLNDAQEINANLRLVNTELLEAANGLVKGYEVGMGKSAIQLRIDLLKQAIQNAQ